MLRRGRPHRAALACLCATLAAGCSSGDREQHVAQLRQIVAETPPAWIARDMLGKRLWTIERRFYEARDFTPAWIDGTRPTDRLDELLETLDSARLHGLDPARYRLRELSDARAQADEGWFGASFDDARVAELDVRLTHAYLSLAADLLAWSATPPAGKATWQPAPKKEDLAARLRAAIDSGEVRDSLDDLAPSHPQYKGLQAALARGDATADEARRIRTNLERWRLAPRDLGDRYVLVNVPAYLMQVMEGDDPVLAMRVIVGTEETPTPMFSDEMTYVVFSPYWNIPESILREETLPRLAEDPDYLARNGIEVVRAAGKDVEVVDASNIDWGDEAAIEGLRFRQAPGPENALGLVKFIFPNHFSVYLHDTPADALFRKARRAFSHGCIRVEKPVALAEYVLADEDRWTRDRIATAMQGQEEQTVRLKQPLPVHIGYWTAWVERDGRVTFTDDPYGLD